MWGKILLGIIGISSGTAVAVAELAFLNAIGVYPRMAAKTRTANHIVWYENVAGIGLLIGTIFSIFHMRVWGGAWLLPFVGFFCGCFVGNVIMGLAEVIEVFPILFRRTGLKIGLGVLVFATALGKLIGSFSYFLLGLWR